MKKEITIIGSGFSSLSAACYMANLGHKVSVYEKNDQLGGRARTYEREGFKFDIGPTWYWMPDVFERFFNDLGKKQEDYYTLERLTPAYRVFFDKMDFVDIESKVEQIVDLFESIEKGSGAKLQKFLNKAEKNYKIAIEDLVYNPGESPLELVSKETMMEVSQFVKTIRGIVNKEFTNPRLRQILEFPVLFLGAKPSKTPAFYSFMNWADFGLGTWYPKGGMYSVVEGIVKLAKELGVVFHSNSEVEEIELTENGTVKGIRINNDSIPVDVLISGADYSHSESLLPIKYRAYSEKYWDKRTMAPSSLLFYVGFSKQLKNVLHHTLFFDTSFDQHASEIYDNPSWPSDPMFYASFASMSDDEMAPAGKEAATFLIPLAPDLEDSPEFRDKYFQIILKRLEELTEQSLADSVEFVKSYCVQDFKDDYHSYKGNAYGMANTLMQTAFLRPKLRSRKVKNLYFTGQLTVPGPGVPPALISGKLVSDLITKK